MPRKAATHPSPAPDVPLRVALYLRVSTGRQAEGDVSLPSQRSQTLAHCERQGWSVVDEYVEPGATGTDDRRPAFQGLIDRACDADQPYDVILVHAFSRFYRDGAEMELLIRRLRRHGVEVVSVTQPSGRDPSAEMIRQIIGIFDEYTSKENGKQVRRAMTENARQGFWNGATPPLGYRIVEAERRGAKVKKKLAPDPVEQELYFLIVRLYLDGDPATSTPPLGIKAMANWLNTRGYRTREGGLFGIGPLHHILTNTAYIGRWRYNVRDAKTRETRPESEWVEIAVPALIDEARFNAVQAKLAANNPRVSPVRAVSGPILLTSLAKCAHCGSGMTQRTGTSRSGKVYAYYTCAGRAQKGPAVCTGNTIPMATLDSLVLSALEERLFAPARLAQMLEGLMARRAGKREGVQARLVQLQAEVSRAEEGLRRLYKLVETGAAEVDDVLAERLAVLKADREKAKAALERVRREVGSEVVIAPEKVVTFGELMRSVLRDGTNPVRKAYLRALLSEIVVSPDRVRIMGHPEVLHAAVASATPSKVVQFSVPEWRARKDSNL